VEAMPGSVEAMPGSVEAMPVSVEATRLSAQGSASPAGGVGVTGPGRHPAGDDQAAPHQPAPTTDWRLRGMATLPEARGTGLGGALLEACLDHIARNGGTRLWCNARTTAAGFYVRYSFNIHGEAFDLPGIGPHYRMSRLISPARRPGA
ncbi:MAG: acetyltransferase, partial [bacterium]